MFFKRLIYRIKLDPADTSLGDTVSGQITTPPKVNIAPEKWWLEAYCPIGKVPFQGRTVKLRGGIIPKPE